MYAFVHIEKTAGSTLLTILRRSFGARHCDIRLPLAKRQFDTQDHRAFVEAADLRHVRRLYRNLSGISGHNVKPYADLQQECPQLKFITILRDPAARFRSHFFNRSMSHTRADFDYWISQEWLHNWQTKMIAGKSDAASAIELIEARFGFVGLTERFDESLVLLANSLGESTFRPQYRAVNRLSDKNRPRDLARKNTDMSYMESEDTKARVRAANVEDQKVYDYIVANVYPRQVAAYPGDLAAAVEQLKQQNARVTEFVEPWWGAFKRNYVYKPLIHCHAM
jgi:hypothetical protein